MSTKKITTVGMLCAMAMIVNVFISFPIVPAVSFLRYDPKDILIVIGGFIYGPMTSLLMSFICSIFEIMLKGGNILDVLMNMVSTCSFACIAAVHKKVHITLIYVPLCRLCPFCDKKMQFGRRFGKINFILLIYVHRQHIAADISPR